MNLTDELAKLAELHENGHLTDEEYAAAKKRLLEPPAEEVPDGIPLAHPVLEAEPVERPRRRETPTWEQAVIASTDGMSDAYWKAKSRRGLTLVTIVLMVVGLFSFCLSLNLVGEGLGPRSAHREEWERGALVALGFVSFLGLVGMFAWSFFDPVKAGLGAIAWLVVVGILSAGLAALGMEAENQPAERGANPGMQLMVGWMLRLGVIVALVWGVLDAREVRRHVRSSK
jgi:hypothetical protein